MNPIKKAMILPAASLLLGGCGLLTTPPRSEYAAFAQAGAGYAEAVGKVLVAAGRVQVDSSSWMFVRNKDSVGVSEESYNALTHEDKDRIEKINYLRTHADLLALYFSRLNSLATSDAPEKTKASIEGVVKSMSDLSSALQTSSPNVFKGLPQLTSIAVDLRIRAVLREELEKNKDVIRRELCIQDLLLKRLSKDIGDGLKKEAGVQETLLVKSPIISKVPLAKPEEWVAKRREVMYLPIAINEVYAADKAAEEMRQTFEALLAGDKDAMDRINALVKDIESILAVADAINS